MALRCFIKKILLQIQILMTFKLRKVNMHQQGNDEHEKVKISNLIFALYVMMVIWDWHTCKGGHKVHRDIYTYTTIIILRKINHGNFIFSILVWAMCSYNNLRCYLQMQLWSKDKKKLIFQEKKNFNDWRFYAFYIHQIFFYFLDVHY